MMIVQNASLVRRGCLVAPVAMAATLALSASANAAVVSTVFRNNSTAAPDSWNNAGNWTNGIPGANAANTVTAVFNAANTSTSTNGSTNVRVALGVSFYGLVFENGFNTTNTTTIGANATTTTSTSTTNFQLGTVAAGDAAPSTNLIDVQTTSGVVSIVKDNKNIPVPEGSFVRDLRVAIGRSGNFNVAQGGTLDISAGIVPVTGGTSTITKTGGGLLILSGGATNTFNGLVINEGVVEFGGGNANSLGATAGGLTLNGGTVRNGYTGATTSRGIIMGDNGGTVETPGTRTLTLSGAVSGTGRLTKTGTGTLTLSSTSSSTTGGIQVNAGIVNAASVSVFGNNTSLNATKDNQIGIADGATLNYSADFNAIAVLASRVGITLVNGGKLGVTDAETGLIVYGAIKGTGPLTKVGAGRLILNNLANSFSGDIVVDAGTLEVNTQGTFGSTALKTVTVNNATLAFDKYDGANTDVAQTRNFALGSANSKFNVVADEAWSIAGSVSGTGKLNKDGAGTLTLAGPLSYSGGTAVNAGTLILGDDAELANGNIAVAAGAALDGTGTINFDITNNTPDTFTSAGTVDITGLKLDLDFIGTQTSNAPYTILSGSYTGLAFAEVKDLGEYQITYGTNAITIAVPEPTSLAALGLAGVLGLRRRRKSA